MHLWQLFPPVWACLLILLTGFFLILMKSSLSIISFMDHGFGVESKKSSLNPRSSRFTPMSSSRNFIVLYFTVSSVILCEVMCVQGVRSGSGFSLVMHVGVRRSSVMCWKNYLCSTVLPLLLCRRSVASLYGGVFLGSLFWSIVTFVCSFANSTLSWLLWRYNELWSWAVSARGFILPFRCGAG